MARRTLIDTNRRVLWNKKGVIISDDLLYGCNVNKLRIMIKKTKRNARKRKGEREKNCLKMSELEPKGPETA